jgi:DNA-binding transcriptional ArsR family regulator
VRQFLNITKALSDESRVRVLLLLGGGELCLCQIIEFLGLAPSTVSKHMAILLQAGLVDCRKEGRWHYYRLPERDAMPCAREALAWVESALGRSPAALEDRKRLRAILKKDKEEICACYKS